VGGYDDWLRQAAETRPAKVVPATVKTRKPTQQRPRKLTFKEERELETLPDKIGELEEEQESLHRTLADPEFYKNSGGEVAALNARLGALELELAEAYRRWEELEALV
jgi:ATP-binding cassette subfamily F protein uup